MALVFTYGPETLQGRMYDRIGPSKCLGSAILQDFELVFDKPNIKNKAEGLANMRPAKGQSIFGLLFDLDPKQIDLYDGFYGGYGQKKVSVVPEGTETSRPAIAWMGRRTGKGLLPSFAGRGYTIDGMEENGADAAFIEAVRNLEALEVDELIIKFNSGVSEDDAQAAVKAAGATVRRKMRTDEPEEIMLLVRVAHGGMEAVEKAMADDENVEMTERNQDGFSVRK